MGTFGGRRTVARASALLALSVLLSAPLLAGCTAALDQAHSVQTKLGRIDQVADATVSSPSDERAAAITIDYTGVATERQLARLVAEVGRVADHESYPAYRLDLVPTESPGDTLVVDSTFAGSDVAPSVLTTWLRVTAALLGDVTYSYQQSNESIAVDSGAGVAHDVSEASRIGYGFRDTTWTFTNAGTVFVVSGRVSPTDVLLFSGVQRSVSSGALPAPAAAWRLERRTDHLLLDLDVTFTSGPVAPARLTVERYGEDVRRLVVAALDALRVAGLPVWLRLHHRAAPGDPGDPAGTPDDDVFGYWVAGQSPVRGRDPLLRGWDRWLAALARSAR
ncbi:hypothetical protein [Nocardioides sp.]|uniref:hypothetical protein n=1 Tax=Nocardioides sp. TaxID=35761 RepID=UPI00261F853C|nr:hypothetical protein [Nocardioides sp.]MDI6910710.1 hypothetical protein [Nocardioides sp.]